MTNDSGSPFPSRFWYHRKWAVQVIESALRWDTQVSTGEQDGPMPATLAASLSQVRTMIAELPDDPEPMPHTIVYNGAPGCWCGESHG